MMNRILHIVLLVSSLMFLSGCTYFFVHLENSPYTTVTVDVNDSDTPTTDMKAALK